MPTLNTQNFRTCTTSPIISCIFMHSAAFQQIGTCRDIYVLIFIRVIRLICCSHTPAVQAPIPTATRVDDSKQGSIDDK